MDAQISAMAFLFPPDRLAARSTAFDGSGSFRGFVLSTGGGGGGGRGGGIGGGGMGAGCLIIESTASVVSSISKHNA